MNKEQNELLRSAYQIAKRKGKDTNWETFENSVCRELLSQAGIPNSIDEQQILRATCTPRTYRKILDYEELDCDFVCETCDISCAFKDITDKNIR